MFVRSADLSQQTPTVLRMVDLFAGPGAFLTGLLNGGLAVAAFNARTDRRAKRRDLARADVRAAQDALLALRQAYRRRARNEPDAPSDSDLNDLADAFDMAAQRTMSDEVARQAASYRAVGDLYAVRDEDHGEGAEQVAYEAVTAALRSIERRNR
jgi:hypothetical protein